MIDKTTYRTTEAAALLGVDARTIVRWIETGDIKAEKMNPLRVNSPFRIPKSEIERIIELRKTVGKAKAQG